MSEYRLPREAVQVSLRCAREPTEQPGVLFVEPAGPDGEPTGARVLNLLNERDSFVPIEFEAGVRLVGLNHVRWLRIDAASGVDPVEPRIGVSLRMDGLDECVEGELTFGGPPARNRLLDRLNASGRFFALHQGGRLVLVNRDAVIAADERGG